MAKFDRQYFAEYAAEKHHDLKYCKGVVFEIFGGGLVTVLGTLGVVKGKHPITKILGAMAIATGVFVTGTGGAEVGEVLYAEKLAITMPEEPVVEGPMTEE